LEINPSTNWVGRPCTHEEKVESWAWTLGWIVVLYFGLWQALGALQAAATYALQHNGTPFRLLFYSKLFELFSNACGFIIAFSIVNSCSASIKTDTLTEKGIYIVLITAACITLSTFMKGGPQKILSRKSEGGCWNISAKGWTEDRKVL
jgi:hypothetical protein